MPPQRDWRGRRLSLLCADGGPYGHNARKGGPEAGRRQGRGQTETAAAMHKQTVQVRRVVATGIADSVQLLQHRIQN